MKKTLKDQLNNKNAILVAIAALALSTSSAFAQVLCTTNTNWTDGSGNWFTAGNWDHGVPNSNTGASINNGGTAQIGSFLNANACSLILGNDISNSGSVSINGSAGLTVADSVVVGNKGTGNLTVATGGTVASGNATIAAQAGELWTSNGTVTLNAGASWSITGNLTLGAGNATMAFGVTPTSSGKVTVSGTATLSSGKHLIITFSAADYTPNTRYTLITANGGRSGTFSVSFINTPSNICPQINYDSRHVYLDLPTCTN
jgi:T5SS/PEP-CTERM-associated repeat protein